MWKPELLAPAKNLERLKVAVTYGADAVYVGGQKYGLRARADNFSELELTDAVSFAHAHGAKVYVTLNAFLHDDDFEGLPDYCQFLEKIGVDAVIVSDLGVLLVVRQSCAIDIHLSTQASCLNSQAAQVWRAMGAKRLILGRELTVAEAGRIRQQAGIEVEMFTHGAMCMAYSGHCTISNYTAGRDSNRGGCVQSCRFPYDLQSMAQPNLISAQALRDNVSAVTFMSSKDLLGVGQIADFFEQRVCSLKIEGRMKSSLYVATTVKAYRQLIDAYAAGTLNADLIDQVNGELEAMPHRDYFAGSLDAPAGPDSVFGQLSGINTGSHKYLGLVVDTTADQIVLRLTEPLTVGDAIEIVPVHSRPIRWQVDRLTSVMGRSIRAMRKDNVVCLPKTTALEPVSTLNVARIVHPNDT
ncbi:MAG: peptidase U32 family protein [Anaerolineae bacterium]|nr:peptidase U32 family protein [Anaerolineae bacterium]